MSNSPMTPAHKALDALVDAAHAYAESSWRHVPDGSHGCNPCRDRWQELDEAIRAAQKVMHEERRVAARVAAGEGKP